MTANPILLQRKYARIIQCFAEMAGITLREAMDFFYRSQEHELLRQGISNIHCMSDQYIAQDLMEEYSFSS